MSATATITEYTSRDDYGRTVYNFHNLDTGKRAAAVRMPKVYFERTGFRFMVNPDVLNQGHLSPLYAINKSDAVSFARNAVRN